MRMPSRFNLVCRTIDGCPVWLSYAAAFDDVMKFRIGPSLLEPHFPQAQHAAIDLMTARSPEAKMLSNR